MDTILQDRAPKTTDLCNYPEISSSITSFLLNYSLFQCMPVKVDISSFTEGIWKKYIHF